MELKITQRVTAKLLEKHNVTHQEVAECFANRHGPVFTDTRENHQTNPPTYWFVSETDTGRILKVIFVRYPDNFAIKSAFPPNDGSDALYEDLCKRRT